MAYITRRDLVLLLLGVSPVVGQEAQGLSGITRLQKLLYLLEQQHAIKPQGDGFEFAAYKVGPYSARIYDDLEFLENLGLIKSEVAGEVTEEAASEIDLLDFDELMGDSADNSAGAPADGFGAADAYEERRFHLTQEGFQRVNKLIQDGGYEPIVDGIRKIKSKFGTYSLSDLLYYIYTNYPEMTTESEIKDKVLYRGRACRH